MDESIDLTVFERDLDLLQAELRKGDGVDDLAHLKKIERWGRLCGALGFMTAWMIPNPISAFLISQAKFTRWTMVAHPVLHKGYDRIPGVPDRYTSKGFARGWRRFADWFDWMLPEGWKREHNQLHHFHLGEKDDPDLVEHNVKWLRKLHLPVSLKMFIVLAVACIWKITYYAANTLKVLHIARVYRKTGKKVSYDLLNFEFYNPLDRKGRELWLRCYLPYISWNFILLPLLFFPLGLMAVINVLFNQFLAEVFTNMHSFMAIATNHAGEDLFVFDDPPEGKGEFYLRQILGSTNFNNGSDSIDFLHGWLNYQIEHHLWPNMTMLQYRKAQPQVKAICKKHGIPYVQESVFRRIKKTIAVITGQTSMRRWNRSESIGQRDG